MRIPALCLLFLAATGVSQAQIGSPFDASDTGPEVLIEGLQATRDLSFEGSMGGRNRNSPAPREYLPEAAQNLLNELEQIPPDRPRSFARCLEDVQKLQNAYARANDLDNAVTLRDIIEEFRDRQRGVLPDPGNLAAFREQTGKTFSFAVTGQRSGSVYGTGVYTDDSTLSAVAVHAGLLAEGERGVVKVTILKGQEHYEGAEQNGVVSQPYGNWQGSYSAAAVPKRARERHEALPQDARALFTSLEQIKNPERSHSQIRDGIRSLRTLQASYARALQLDEAVAIRDALLQFIGKLVGAKPQPINLTTFRGQDNQEFYFFVTGRTVGSVWGNGLYTDDSDLGAVAVHAGLLRAGQKGILKVTIQPGADQYEGAESNGVKSSAYGAWQGSYRVEPVNF